MFYVVWHFNQFSSTKRSHIAPVPASCSKQLDPNGVPFNANMDQRITSQPPSTSLQVLLWWGKIPLHCGQWGFPFGLSILLLVARCHLVTWRHFTQHPIQVGQPWQPPGPASSLTFAPKSLVARSWITIFACKILDIYRYLRCWDSCRTSLSNP